MYGKLFESAFNGSMCGAGANVFAVWAYIIAHAKKGVVEINPILVAAAIGMPADHVDSALDYLQSPDPKSRNRESEGRRIVREGQFLYRVVSYDHYHSIRNEDDRRAYNAAKQREYRAKRASMSMTVNDSQSPSPTVNDGQHAYAHTEAEEETSTPLTPQGGTKPRKRRTKNELMEPYSDEVKAASSAIVAIWPKKRGSDGTVSVSLFRLAERLSDLLARFPGHLDADILVEVAREYVKANPDYPNDPHHFFGKSDDAPWKAFARGILTKRAK